MKSYFIRLKKYVSVHYLSFQCGAVIVVVVVVTVDVANVWILKTLFMFLCFLSFYYAVAILPLEWT